MGRHLNLDQLLSGDADIDKVADWLESLSDKQLEEHFKQYFDVTRPERARASKPKTQQPMPFITPGKRRALQALQAIEGFDMELFNKRRKRK